MDGPTVEIVFIVNRELSVGVVDSTVSVVSSEGAILKVETESVERQPIVESSELETVKIVPLLSSSVSILYRSDSEDATTLMK